MKKLLVILLAVCLLLPACAPAEDRDPIVGCWAMLIDGEKYPEFMQSFGNYDSMMSIYYFLSNGTVMLLENDVTNGTAQPYYTSSGKWEKSGDFYKCSIIGIGGCTITLRAETAIYELESMPGVSMKLRYIRTFDPYSDYIITR